MFNECLFIFFLVYCCLSNAMPSGNRDLDVQSLNGFDFTGEFYDLDLALRRRTSDTTPEFNFEAASQIYQDNLEDNIKPRSKINKAIQLFLALRTIEKGNKCNYESANLIEQNNRATDRKALQEGGGNLERVAVLVRMIGRQHAQECQLVYETRFSDILNNMDRSKVARVEEFLRDLIEQHISDKYKSNVGMSLTQRYYNIASWQINPTRKLFNLDFLYKELKRVSKDDTESNYLMPVYDERRGMKAFASDRIYELFQKYFVEPCKYYRQELGHELFDQKDFDGLFGETNENNPEFYKAWAQFHLCGAFAERSASIYSNFITNLIRKEDEIVRSMEISKK